jgi:hypothetical protein
VRWDPILHARSTRSAMTLGSAAVLVHVVAGLR